MSNYQMVREFHAKFLAPLDEPQRLNDQPFVDLRHELIREEFAELKEAAAEKDMVGVVDALADILYVTYGYGAALGIDLDEAFRRVHESNMSKLGADGKPIFREDGKVLKGPGYFKPDLVDLAPQV